VKSPKWLVVVLCLVAIGGIALAMRDRDERTHREPTTAQPPPLAAASPHKHGPSGPAGHPSTVPEVGKPLFDFLLAEIPDLVDKIPCSCCSYKLGQCFRGACPHNCGPCNMIGKDVYEWHRAGLSDDEILKRVHERYFTH